MQTSLRIRHTDIQKEKQEKNSCLVKQIKELISHQYLVIQKHYYHYTLNYMTFLPN